MKQDNQIKKRYSMSDREINGKEQPAAQKYPDDPFLRHDEKASQSEMPVIAYYWHFRATLSMFVEGIVLMKQDVTERAGWTFRLLTDDLPKIDEQCCMKDCQRESVARFRNDRPRSDGTPACRRHYLTVKIMVYGTLLIGFVLLAAAYYWLVIV